MAWPKDRTRRQEAVDRVKERFAGVPETATFGHPVAGEITVADLGTLGFPGHPSEYSREVESWAKSVAQNRFL